MERVEQEKKIKGIYSLKKIFKISVIIFVFSKTLSTCDYPKFVFVIYVKLILEL